MSFDFRLVSRLQSLVYEQKPVLVRFKKTFYGLSSYVQGASDPIEEAHEASVPRWLAKGLVAKGYAEYASPPVPVKQRLSKSIWQEEQNNAVQKIDANFYVELGAAIDELMRLNDPNTVAVKSKLQDFLRIRVKKIRRLAETKTQMDFLEALTPEERAWFENYRKMFQEWVEPTWFTEFHGFQSELWLSLDG
jgi:hypothetical protein